MSIPVTKLNHSYSAFKMFENCALNYYRQRITKEVKDSERVAMVEGNRQHKAMEDRINLGTPLPKDMAELEVLCAAIVSAAKRGTMVAEKEMVLNQNLKPTGWWDKDAWFRTKADLFVSYHGDTHCVILDYKSGKRRPDFLQMDLMALTAFLHYPVMQKVDTSFVWFKDKAEDGQVYMREEMPRLTQTLLAHVARIEKAVANDRWPARPSGLCDYCPCKPTCRWAR